MESTIVDLIVQKEINDVIDNDFTQSGKMIKQKEKNHEKMLSNIKNVPYKSDESQKSDSSSINMMPNFNIVPTQYIELVEGQSKPINVKENSFINILENGNSKSEEVVDKKGEEQMAESHEVTNEVSTNEVVNEDSNVKEINDRFKELDSTRQSLQNVKEEAKLAEAEVNQTTEDLNKLSVEQTEIDKKIESAKIRKEEIKKKVIEALNRQSDILKKAKQDYEDVMFSANRRKEENQNKIVEFQAKLDESKEKLTQEEAEIAEQQALLDAINNSENPISFSDLETNEESYKKVA